MMRSLHVSMRSLVQAAAVIGAQGFTSIANFLMGVLLARACSKADWGVYFQCIALLNIISGIQISFTAYPYTILHPQLNGARQRTYLGSTLLLQLGIVCAVAILFLVAGAGLSLAGGAPSLVHTIWVLSVAGAVFLMRDSTTAMILGRLQVWRNFFMMAGGGVATMAGIGVCYASGRLTVPVSFMVFAACTGIPIALAVYFGLWRPATVQMTSFRGDVGENWRIGKWLVAKTFANMAAVSVFPFLLGIFHGSRQAAVYGTCLMYANLLNPLIVGISSFFRPRAAHANAADPNRLRRMTLLCVSALSLLVAAFLAVTVVWGGRILAAIFGAGYEGLDTMLVLAVLANSIWVLSGPISIAIDVRERTDATFRGRLVGCAISVVFGVILVMQFGPLGAVIALALSWAGTALYWLREFLLLSHPGQEAGRERAAVSA